MAACCVAVYYTSTAVSGLDSYYTVLAQVATFVAVSEPSLRDVVLLYITLVLRWLVWIVIILCWPWLRHLLLNLSHHGGTLLYITLVLRWLVWIVIILCWPWL